MTTRSPSARAPRWSPTSVGVGDLEDDARAPAPRPWRGPSPACRHGSGERSPAHHGKCLVVLSRRGRRTRPDLRVSGAEPGAVGQDGARDVRAPRTRRGSAVGAVRHRHRRTPLGRRRTRGGSRRAPRGAVRRSFAGRAGPGGRSRRGTAGSSRSRQARRATRAEGAGDSGLSRLIELHAFNAAGDAAVAISLAGTLFFQVPTGEARGQVALFLGLTMLPFAIVAPLIGPFLDRFSHGRRWAVGATMAIRCFLCWVLATAVVTESDVAVPGGAGLPRRLQGVRRHPRRRGPPPAAARPHAGQGQRPGLARRRRRRRAVGAARRPRLDRSAPEWSLRYGFVVFVLATIWAIRLPQKVDSSQGEGELVLTGSTDAAAHRPPPADAGSPARWPSRCGPTAGRAGSRASSRCSWRSCCATTRSATGSPEVLLGARHRRGGPRQHPRHRARRRCSDASTRR